MSTLESLKIKLNVMRDRTEINVHDDVLES